MMIIENITHPNQEPQDGDLLRYNYDNGVIIEKRFYEEQPRTQRTSMERCRVKKY